MVQLGELKIDAMKKELQGEGLKKVENAKPIDHKIRSFP